MNQDYNFSEITDKKSDIEMSTGHLPRFVTKGELFKDRWINKIINVLLMVSSARSVVLFTPERALACTHEWAGDVCKD